ncbi:MAG TPA: hypothetical protein DDZ80_25320 [Cyanobacteria bacterium UBA8803]|nr:hypothetical protein [Cyanobacteria bacterium UBA9273]HBL61615.1 hypothetical protein [Cyanobacteria bacterium UBA8803]
MSLFFIIPLAAFVVAAYVFKHSADEIAYLSAAIALVSLLLTLLLAPWQIQLLLLMLVVFSNKRQSLSSSPLPESHSEEEEKTKLVYRGAYYKAAPPQVDLIEEEIKGKYRGQVWSAHDIAKESVPHPNLNLKYRGVIVADKT